MKKYDIITLEKQNAVLVMILDCESPFCYLKHPGSLDILGNPAFPLYKRDVVDFLKAFPAQFIGKFFHIAVELPVPRGVCPFRSAPRGTQSY